MYVYGYHTLYTVEQHVSRGLRNLSTIQLPVTITSQNLVYVVRVLLKSCVHVCVGLLAGLMRVLPFSPRELNKVSADGQVALP